jgi:hypothetical protein
MRINAIALATTAVLGGLLSMPALAGSVTKTQTQNAATACALSIPTTDTKVRPKATGFRNEGTTNQFVICAFDIDSVDPGFHSIQLSFASIDGAAHNVSCTAASRFNSSTSAQYLTKNVAVPAGGTATFSIADTDPDYDTNVYDLYPWGQSVTCTLTPGTAITSLQSSHDDEDSAP